MAYGSSPSRQLIRVVSLGRVASANRRIQAPPRQRWMWLRCHDLRLVKQRLHQVVFRDGMLAAHDRRCAISNLPDDHLLDAAHIMADAMSFSGSRCSPTASPSRRSITRPLIII
jgi:hypothetical protein